MTESDRAASQDDRARFCARLGRINGLQPVDLALGILCWHELHDAGTPMSTWDVAKILTAHGLANPNRETLAAKLISSGLTLRIDGNFRLKAGAIDEILKRLQGAFTLPLPQIDLEAGYLPRDVWRDTRGYLENVCVQINGCYQFGFYDAASVMIRRAVETLIIEAYEHSHRETEIKDNDGNYFMLGELVTRSLGGCGLTLGRESKAALKEVKKLGDRSAHNRRYNSVKADLDTVRSGVRVTVDELINMASLRRKG